MRIIIFLITFSLISLLGCGKKFDGLTSKKQKFYSTLNPAIFQAEVTEFIKAENLTNPNKNLQNLTAEYQATLLMQSMPINLYDLTIDYKAEKYVGVCNTDPKSGSKEILIDTTWWNDNPKRRTLLILHELGHCWPSLRRSHFNVPTNNSNCRSIMEASLIPLSVYENHTEYLQYELFNKLPELNTKKPSATAHCPPPP